MIQAMLRIRLRVADDIILTGYLRVRFPEVAPGNLLCFPGQVETDGVEFLFLDLGVVNQSYLTREQAEMSPEWRGWKLFWGGDHWGDAGIPPEVPLQEPG